MVQRQRENVAKYLYDISKFVFATVVLGNFVAGRSFDVLSLINGISGAYIFFWWGYSLDGNGGSA